MGGAPAAQRLIRLLPEGQLLDGVMQQLSSTESTQLFQGSKGCKSILEQVRAVAGRGHGRPPLGISYSLPPVQKWSVQTPASPLGVCSASSTASEQPELSLPPPAGSLCEDKLNAERSFL